MLKWIPAFDGNLLQELTLSSCSIQFVSWFSILQFALLESSSVDDDLANLKKELSGSSKVCLCTSFLSWKNGTFWLVELCL